MDDSNSHFPPQSSTFSRFLCPLFLNWICFSCNCLEKGGYFEITPLDLNNLIIEFSKDLSRSFIAIWAVSIFLSTVTTRVMDLNKVLVVRNHSGIQSYIQQTECIAFFSPLYTITSATISFIIPGKSQKCKMFDHTKRHYKKVFKNFIVLFCKFYWLNSSGQASSP